LLWSRRSSSAEEIFPSFPSIQETEMRVELVESSPISEHEKAMALATENLQATEAEEKKHFSDEDRDLGELAPKQKNELLGGLAEIARIQLRVP